MTKLIAILFVGVAAAGCSTSFNRLAMEQELQGEQRIVFDDVDVLKIEQLRPQIQFPIRLAVVPPARVSPRYWQEGSAKGEHEELMALGEQLKKEGIVSSFTVIPRSCFKARTNPSRRSDWRPRAWAPTRSSS